MLCIAHRGAKGHAPENTLSAFRKGIELGANGIELDVHLSHDGEIIVIHDETVDRTTDGFGKVSGKSLAEIKSLTVFENEKVPELSEVLDLCGAGFLINIELKTFETAVPVVKLVERYVVEKGFAYTQFLISSFDWTALEEVRKRHPEITIGVLTETDLKAAMAFAATVNAETIHPHFSMLDQEITKEIQEKGFRVFTWTVNTPEAIQTVQSFGVDGLITDYPDRV